MLLFSFGCTNTLGLFCITDSPQGWLLCAELSVLDSLPSALCKTLVLVEQVLLFLVKSHIIRCQLWDANSWCYI